MKPSRFHSNAIETKANFKLSSLPANNTIQQHQESINHSGMFQVPTFMRVNWNIKMSCLHAAASQQRREINFFLCFASRSIIIRHHAFGINTIRITEWTKYANSHPKSERLFGSPSELLDVIIAFIMI